MDPTPIAGSIATCAQLISHITNTINGLTELRGRIEGTDEEIQLLIRELKIVKAALSRVQVWGRNNRAAVESSSGELNNQFGTAKNNVELSLQLFGENLQRLAGNIDHGNATLVTKAQCAWNDEVMEEHQVRLHQQVVLVQTLVQAVQCSTTSEQIKILRDPKNVEMLQKVSDDTSSLRTKSTRSPSTVISSVHSVSDLESDIRSTEPYRRPPQRSDTSARLTTANIAAIDEEYGEAPVNLEEPRNVTTPERMERDSGIGLTLSPEGTTSQPDTAFSFEAKSPTQRPRSAQDVGESEFLSPTRKWRRPIIDTAAVSDSVVPQLLSPDLTPSLAKKKSWFSRLGRSKSQIKLPENQSPASSTRRWRRSEGSIDTSVSIDFGSIEGLSAPDIIRAAQAGSVREIEELLEQGADINQIHLQSGKCALSVAAHCGNDDVVDLLLQRGARTDIKDRQSMAPLHLAASRGHYRVVELLLQERVEIDIPGPGRCTPLRLAADNGHLDVMKLLLINEARVNARDQSHSTALHAAAKRGDNEVAEILLNNGAKFEAKDADMMAAIHYACQGTHVGHELIVEAILSKKKNDQLEFSGKHGMSPLTCACASGSVRIVKLLLQKKANLKHRSESGMTPLHWAAFNGHSDILDMILAKKVAVDLQMDDGRTALHLSVTAANETGFDTADLLIRNKANIEASCKKFMRPLHYACMQSDDKVVSLLLESGAQKEAEAQLQRRPLHLASMRGATTIVMMLLEKGCDSEARDAGLDRALCLASAYGHAELVSKLLDRGIPQRARFSKNNPIEDSPLCMACKNGHVEVVRAFLYRDASVRQRDEQSWQPLRYAAYHGHPEIVSLLMDFGATISSLAPSGGWGFNMTPERIGFAPNVNEETKGQVLRLLYASQAREDTNETTVAPGVSLVSAMSSEQSTSDIHEMEPDRGSSVTNAGRPVYEMDNNGNNMARSREERTGEPGSSSTVPQIRVDEPQTSRAPQSPPQPAPLPPFRLPPVPPSIQESIPTRTYSISPSTAESNQNLPYRSYEDLYRPSFRPSLPFSDSSEHSVSPFVSVNFGSSPAPAPAPASFYSSMPRSNVSQGSYYGGFVPTPLRPLSDIEESIDREERVREITTPTEEEFSPGDVVACLECQEKGFSRPDMDCSDCRRVLGDYRIITGQTQPSRTAPGIYELE